MRRKSCESYHNVHAPGSALLHPRVTEDHHHLTEQEERVAPQSFRPDSQPRTQDTGPNSRLLGRYRILREEAIYAAIGNG
jgi:hypothetical protein